MFIVSRRQRGVNATVARLTPPSALWAEGPEESLVMTHREKPDFQPLPAQGFDAARRCYA
jgi:hypothetical protein